MLNTKRTLILCSIIFLTSYFTFAQSVRETYNELQERYEYHNSDYELVGYKKKDFITGDWVYTTVSDKSSSNSYRSSYRHLEPVDVFDEDLVFKVLQAKSLRASKISARNDKVRSERASKNIKIIEDNIEYIYSFYYKIMESKDDKFIKRRLLDVNNLMSSFEDSLEDLNSKDIDFSDGFQAQKVVNWVRDYEKRLRKIAIEIEQEIEQHNIWLDLTRKAVMGKLFDIEIDLITLAQDIDNDPELLTSLQNSKTKISQEIKNIQEGNKDFSNKDHISEYMEHLTKYQSTLLKIRSERESALPHKYRSLLGGYKTNFIWKYYKDPITKEFILQSDENIDSEFYFTEKEIYIKIGGNEWSIFQIEKIDYDNFTYTFTDSFNRRIIIDKEWTKITRFIQKDEYTATMYYALEKDKTVKPLSYD